MGVIRSLHIYLKFEHHKLEIEGSWTFMERQGVLVWVICEDI